MSEAFEKFMESQCEDCAFEFMDDAEYCTECGLRFKGAYTAGLLRAAEIAMDGACKNTCSCPDCQPKHKIAAAIRKEVGDESIH